MESLYLLIPVAIIFLVIAVRVLFWAVNSGQYDDLETEGHRILFDEPPAPKAALKRTDQEPSLEEPAADRVPAGKKQPHQDAGTQGD